MASQRALFFSVTLYMYNKEYGNHALMSPNRYKLCLQAWHLTGRVPYWVSSHACGVMKVVRRFAEHDAFCCSGFPSDRVLPWVIPHVINTGGKNYGVKPGGSVNFGQIWICGKLLFSSFKFFTLYLHKLLAWGTNMLIKNCWNRNWVMVLKKIIHGKGKL